MNTQKRELFDRVCFVVTGDFITEHAQGLVLERDWQRAFAFLRDSFHGEFTDEMCFSVCRGDTRLIGDSTVGIKLKNTPDVEYKSELDRMYSGYLVHSKGFFQPYAFVSNYGEADFSDGRLKYGKIDYWPDKLSSPEHHGDYCQQDIRYRPYHYADEPMKDIVIVCKLKRHDMTDNYSVLFRKVEPPPLWLRNKASRLPQDAVNEYIACYGMFEERGYKQSYGQLSISAANVSIGKSTKEETQEEEEVEPEIPDPSLKSAYGWIAPNGDFYGCQRKGHSYLADCLWDQFYAKDVLKQENSEYNIEQKGWLKVTDSCVDGELLLLCEKDLTQAQLDTVFDWCQKHGKNLPKDI